jgi:hypothetical protein
VHAAGIASLAGSSVQTVSWVGCVVCRCVSVCSLVCKWW